MEVKGFVEALKELDCDDLRALHRRAWNKVMNLTHRSPENYHAYMMVMRNIETQMLHMSCYA